MRWKPCLWPRCPELVPLGSSYCAAHLKVRSRQGLTGAGRSAQFARSRREVLRRQHGRCAVCGQTATAVHHIGSVDDDRLENLQALCSDCHRAAHQRPIPGDRAGKAGG
jgi:5-methylcytosine-specific restriction endonuclease McrA